MEGGKEESQARGDGTKKVTLYFVSYLVEKGEHVDR